MQIIVVLCVVLGGYAFFLQSRLAIEVKSLRRLPCLMLWTMLRLDDLMWGLIQDSEHAFARSKGFKGEGALATEVHSLAGLCLVMPVPGDTQLQC